MWLIKGKFKVLTATPAKFILLILCVTLNVHKGKQARWVTCRQTKRFKVKGLFQDHQSYHFHLFLWLSLSLWFLFLLLLLLFNWPTERSWERAQPSPHSEKQFLVSGPKQHPALKSTEAAGQSEGPATAHRSVLPARAMAPVPWGMQEAAHSVGSQKVQLFCWGRSGNEEPWN